MYTYRGKRYTTFYSFFFKLKAIFLERKSYESKKKLHYLLFNWYLFMYINRKRIHKENNFKRRSKSMSKRGYFFQLKT